MDRHYSRNIFEQVLADDVEEMLIIYKNNLKEYIESNGDNDSTCDGYNDVIKATESLLHIKDKFSDEEIDYILTRHFDAIESTKDVDFETPFLNIAYTLVKKFFEEEVM